MAVTVRPALAGDAQALAEIYNAGLAERSATFETRPRTADDFARLVAPGALPVVVAEIEGEVAGFASSSPYSPRECYAGIREFSVYVARARRRRGLARALLAALIEANAAAGGWKLVGRIFTDNQASLALCEGLGFRRVGVHLAHARLDGVWKDVVLVERAIGTFSRPGA